MFDTFGEFVSAAVAASQVPFDPDEYVPPESDEQYQAGLRSAEQHQK